MIAKDVDEKKVLLRARIKKKTSELSEKNRDRENKVYTVRRRGLVIEGTTVREGGALSIIAPQRRKTRSVIYRALSPQLHAIKLSRGPAKIGR